MNWDQNELQERLRDIEQVMVNEDIETVMTDWEQNFVINLRDKLNKNDVEISEKEGNVINEIYEKLWKADII